MFEGAQIWDLMKCAPHRAGQGRTGAAEAQGVQELGAPQLGSQGRHVQGRRVPPLHCCSRDKAVDEVQLGPPQQAGERVLGDKQRSVGLGGRGAKGQHVCRWVIAPVHPLQGVRAPQGVILSARSCVRPGSSSSRHRCEPELQDAEAEWDPSSQCLKLSVDGLQKVTKWPNCCRGWGFPGRARTLERV